MQVKASSGGSSDANLFAAVPDLDLLNALRANQDPGWVAIALRAIGQMIGHPGEGWTSTWMSHDGLEAKPQFPAVAQPVGFGLGRSKVLYLSTGID